MKKEQKKFFLIFGAVFLVVLLGAVIFFVYMNNLDKKNFDNFEKGDFKDMPRDDFGEGNPPEEIKMNLTNEEIEEINLFFDSEPLESEIEVYCEENFFYCIYYCVELNKEFSYCENLTPHNFKDVEQPQ